MIDPAFSCPRDVLRAALERVAKIVEKRNTVPSLSNVRLDVEEDGTLRIEATDLVLVASTSTDGISVIRAGTTTVAADMFLASVKRMPEGTVTVDATDRNLTVKAGRSRATLHTLPSVDFPSITFGEPTHRFTIPAVDLTTIADKCSFSMSNEETRYYLCGVYVHVRDEKLTAVSVDGRRLSKLMLDCPEGAAGMPGIIIPDKMVKHFGLLTERADVPVEVEVAETFVRFVAPSVSIVCRPIDGNFPDYERIVPRDNRLLADMPLEGLREAVERLSIYATDDVRTIKWEFGADSLTLSSKSDAGEASEEIEVDCDFELAIGFNAKFSLDVLKTMVGPQVRMAFESPSSPPLITDLGDDRREGLLMPLRV